MNEKIFLYTVELIYETNNLFTSSIEYKENAL